jgi:hypothetical protein
LGLQGVVKFAGKTGKDFSVCDVLAEKTPAMQAFSVDARRVLP